VGPWAALVVEGYIVERTKPYLVTFVLTLAGLFFTSACQQQSGNPDILDSRTELPGLTLYIKNGQPVSSLDLVAGQDYVFDRITLEVENRDIKNSQGALDWLRKQSSFRVLNWEGVREARAYWRNFKDTRPAADIFAHVFEGAAWMTEPNALVLSVLDDQGSPLGAPLHLSNQDFLNHLKQWDFDMIKSEFRYEDFAQHKDRNSAKVKRAVGKIVFVLQTNPSKRFHIPPEAKSLRVAWDKSPEEAYLFPVRFIASPLPYGLQIEARIAPEKDLYMPGEKIRATFRLLNGRGGALQLSEWSKNGVTRLIAHLDGPRHDPTFYHEEWLNDFTGNRFAYHLRSPALGLVQDGQTITKPLEKPPLDPDGSSMTVEFHIPADLPERSYGTFEIRATTGRNYGGQFIEATFHAPIQVGKREKTAFEGFGCNACHVPGTEMELGLLIPPMVGRERLSVDNLQECVMCHDNSRGGSRRLDKYLHLIHMNRDNFPADKNNCKVCHITVASIKKVSLEVCSTCHETIHADDPVRYTDNECQNCHTDYSSGHIVPGPA